VLPDDGLQHNFKGRYNTSKRFMLAATAAAAAAAAVQCCLCMRLLCLDPHLARVQIPKQTNVNEQNTAAIGSAYATAAAAVAAAVVQWCLCMRLLCLDPHLARVQILEQSLSNKTLRQLIIFRHCDIGSAAHANSSRTLLLLLPGKAYRTDLEAIMFFMLLLLLKADMDAIELCR
jgi:hypothetical protein